MTFVANVPTKGVFVFNVDACYNTVMEAINISTSSLLKTSLVNPHNPVAMFFMKCVSLETTLTRKLPFFFFSIPYAVRIQSPSKKKEKEVETACYKSKCKVQSNP